MNKRKTLLVSSALAVSILACSIQVDLPGTELRTGPTQEKEIEVDHLEAGEIANLELAFGAGKLNVRSGAEDKLVEGIAQYNVVELDPEVSIVGDSIKIEQGNLQIRGFPSLDGDDVINEWDLELGPYLMRLTVQAGAYEGEYDLGGLPIIDLDISDGAASSTLSFNEPNPQEMATLRYNTGASSVELTGLANANFERLIFNSGAGDYTLEFTGDLRRDGTVTMKSGLSSIRIIVPRGVAAELSFEGALADVNYSGGWTKEGNRYVQEGDEGEPKLSFRLEMGAGSLTLANQ